MTEKGRYMPETVKHMEKQKHQKEKIRKKVRKCPFKASYRSVIC